jgi:hypothetical protein
MRIGWSRAEVPSSQGMGAGGAAASVWGDGLEDEALTVLWYPCTWSNVSDDELLLFLPSLAHTFDRDMELRLAHARPATHLRDALCAHVAQLMTRFSGDEHASDSSDVIADRRLRDSLIAILQSENLHRPIALHWALERGRAIQPNWFGPARLGDRRARRWFARVAKNTQPALELELLGLRSIMAALAALEAPSPTPTSTEPPRSHDTLARALLVAMHSGFNSAYIYPDMQVYHQMFSIAGWVGWLQRGRPSLLPAFIAEYLVDLLERPASKQPSDMATALLMHHLEQAAGTAALLRRARRVVAGGGVPVIKPRNSSWREDTAQIAQLLAEFARSESSGGTLAVSPYGVQDQSRAPQASMPH